MSDDRATVIIHALDYPEEISDEEHEDAHVALDSLLSEIDSLRVKSISMAEIADIEIVEPFVRLGVTGDEGSINLDQDTARALYAMAWAMFEKALINANALYSEESADQRDQHDRVKRLLWEATDLRQAIKVVYSMTAMPEEDVA